MIKRIPTIISCLLPKFPFSTAFSQDSFYDWGNPNSYVRAVRENYFLKDIMKGYYYLKEEKIELSEQHITFLAYIFMLFPQSQEIILSDLVDGFNKWEEHESTKDRIPDYILYLRNVNSNIKLAPFIGKMRERINNPKNLSSLKEMQKVLDFVGFKKIGGLEQFYDCFRNKVNELMLNKEYKISFEEINLITQIYKHLIFFDEGLKQEPFLASLPTTYQQDEQTFQNMVNTLLHMMTKHFINILEAKDIFEFHKNISECGLFKSVETQKLTRRYAENLTSLQMTRFITFNKILKPIAEK